MRPGVGPAPTVKNFRHERMELDRGRPLERSSRDRKGTRLRQLPNHVESRKLLANPRWRCLFPLFVGQEITNHVLPPQSASPRDQSASFPTGIAFPLPHP